MNKGIIAEAEYPNFPDKDLLSIVFAETDRDYVVWTYNKKDKNYFGGHYFRKLGGGYESAEEAKKAGYLKFIKKITDMVNDYA